MRVMVTGGAGFIGSAVVRLLIGAGVDVVVVDKLTYAGNLSSLQDVATSAHFQLVKACVTDAEALRRVFDQHEPDAVMHLAAESHVDRSITSAGLFIETNILGTFTLLQEARRYFEALPVERRGSFRFLHVSTDEVFGSLGAEGHFTEETRYDPRSPYSASKAASDHLVRAWWHTYGLPVCVSNCSNNYGPYHLPEKLIPLMILNALEGRPLPVYGDGQNVRDWLFVEDHARALWRIVQAGRVGETYAVGGRSEKTNLQVVEAICALLDELAPGGRTRRELIKFVQDRPGHDRRYAIDAAKIERELGWRPLETFDSGLRRTVLWYLENRWWWEPLRQDGHGLSRLGVLNAG